MAQSYGSGTIGEVDDIWGIPAQMPIGYAIPPGQSPRAFLNGQVGGAPDQVAALGNRKSIAADGTPAEDPLETLLYDESSGTWKPSTPPPTSGAVTQFVHITGARVAATVTPPEFLATLSVGDHVRFTSVVGDPAFVTMFQGRVVAIIAKSATQISFDVTGSDSIDFTGATSDIEFTTDPVTPEVPVDPTSPFNGSVINMRLVTTDTLVGTWQPNGDVPFMLDGSTLEITDGFNGDPDSIAALIGNWTITQIDDQFSEIRFVVPGIGDFFDPFGILLMGAVVDPTGGGVSPVPDGSLLGINFIWIGPANQVQFDVAQDLADSVQAGFNMIQFPMGSLSGSIGFQVAFDGRSLFAEAVNGYKITVSPADDATAIDFTDSECSTVTVIS